MNKTLEIILSISCVNYQKRTKICFFFLFLVPTNYCNYNIFVHSKCITYNYFILQNTFPHSCNKYMYLCCVGQ